MSQRINEFENEWIEQKSIEQIITKVAGTSRLSIAATILLFALLYGRVSTNLWVIWFALHGVVIALRSWIVWGYTSDVFAANTESQVRFYLKNLYTIATIGLAWGSTVYLFNDNEFSIVDAICLNFILFYSIATTINLSTHLKSLDFFVLGYGSGIIGAFIARIIYYQSVLLSVSNIILITSLLLLIIIIKKFGHQLNRTHMSALKLQFNNQRLIATLTQEKQIAIDAVASKNRMLASAAHDMRQPVLALDIYAGWLADEPASSVKIAPKIIASTKAVIELFDSMFDMSRLSEGKINTRLEAVNLAELISELYVHYAPLAKSKNLTLKTHTFEGTVFSDHILLTRILGNLISNAIKYTQTGGVLIACRKTALGVKVEVWDTGVGIEPEQHELVFKEFYKNPSNLGTSDGFGLGLAIVAQLADLIGAKLTLRSRRGRGTVVSIQLGKMI